MITDEEGKEVRMKILNIFLSAIMKDNSKFICLEHHMMISFSLWIVAEEVKTPANVLTHVKFAERLQPSAKWSIMLEIWLFVLLVFRWNPC